MAAQSRESIEGAVQVLDHREITPRNPPLRNNAPMPPPPKVESVELVLSIKRFIEELELAERQPSSPVVDHLMRALGRASAGDLDESRLALRDAERTDRDVLARWSRASPFAMTQLRRRLDAVMQDFDL